MRSAVGRSAHFSPEELSIVVFFPQFNEKEQRYAKGKNIRRSYGHPHAVQLPDKRKQKDGGNLEHKGSHK